MYVKSQDSSVNTPTGYGLDDQMIGFQFLAGAGNFFLRHHVQTSFGVNPPPIQWVQGALSLGVKLITHLHLVLSSKNKWSYTPTPPVRLRGVVLS